MSLIFIDSFDGGDLTTKWSSTSGTLAVNATNSLHDNSLQLSQSAVVVKTVPAAVKDDLFICGFNFFTVSAIGGGLVSFRGDAATTTHFTLTVESDGSLVARRGIASGTSLGASDPGLISNQTWNHIGVKVLLHDSAGTVDVEINGVNVLSLTGLDTLNGGTDPNFDTIALLGPSSGGGAGHRYDDLYVCNGLGSDNNDLLGVCRVNALFPDVDGTAEDWDLSSGSDSFALIDEATPNGDTDYISSEVTGEKTHVGLEDLVDTDHVIFGVQTSTYARKADAGTALFRTGLRSDSQIANGEDRNLTESYVTYLDVFELDPDGDVPWTPTQLNAAEAFVEVRT